MNRIQLFSPLDLVFLSAAIFMLFYTSFNYLVFGLKKENPKNRMLILGFSFLFFGLAISRLIHFLMIFQIKGEYIVHNYYVGVGETTKLFSILSQFYVISFFLGIIFFYILFEKIFQTTHGILTLLNSLLLFLILCGMNFSSLAPLGYYLLIFSIVINIAIIFYIFIWFTRKSSSEFQSIAVIIMISFLFQIIGAILIIEKVVELGIIPLSIPAIFFLMSAIIAFIPIISGRKILSKSSLIWSILIFILITMSLISISVIINFQLDPLNHLLISLLILGAFSIIAFGVHRIYKNLKSSEKVIKIDKGEEKNEVFLKDFIKSKKIKEKDIAISKKMKICVNCGKKLRRFAYICPKCKTFYCKKCLNKIILNEEKKCLLCDFMIDINIKIWRENK